ncbi:response regulator transcription factor [Shewanella litorisediminis]|uniref:Response regulator transcription factor n=1 Tax=Shewanella litorisediminis TaxID=1173586 RepID=A0ABX7G238_9GAMM|nr:response regulator [Shewanella litorisediminis]MCL2918565.1 LuxR C-terminal-related transcriptional regulator [Shewanella litorisediminis]QRH01390.1 response regulator transcription factor [Shewanella litorisediminis]
MRLYLVDDDEAIRDSLTYMLDQCGRQLTSFASAEAFLAQADITQPGCLILDSRMPGLSGEALQHELVNQQSPLGIIFLTGHGDLPMALAAFREGACDFFQKPVQAAPLCDAIDKAEAESQRRYEVAGLRLKLARLSEREAQVLRLLTDGLTNKQISETLYLSLRTIEVHRASMMKKLGVHNLAELGRFACR